MTSKHTSAQARTRDGNFSVSTVTTDAPILPIEQIAKLREIAPDRVDWIFEQTTLESNFRRQEYRRINTLVFAERVLGLIFALLVAIGGLGSAVFLAVRGHDAVAAVLGGVTLVGLVSAFIAAKQASKAQAD